MIDINNKVVYEKYEYNFYEVGVGKKYYFLFNIFYMICNYMYL